MEIVPTEEGGAPVHRVACGRGRRLHVSWGAGHCLQLLDCAAPGAQAEEENAPPPTATCLRW